MVIGKNTNYSCIGEKKGEANYRMRENRLGSGKCEKDLNIELEHD